jgi:chromosome segregation ATPase
MDVRLQNAYVEVLLGNFMEVVKQNLMFQAQLEVLKTDTKDVGENQRRLKDISDNNVELQKQLLEKDKEISRLTAESKDVGENQRRLKEISNNNVELQKQLLEKDREISRLTTERNDLKNSFNNNNSLAQEKQRLQSAVNDYMRQLNEAKNETLRVKSESQDVLLQNNNRIEELTKYVTRLEAAIPANKLKKTKLGENIQSTPEVTEPEITLPIDDSVKNGGTF